MKVLAALVLALAVSGCSDQVIGAFDAPTTGSARPGSSGSSNASVTSGVADTSVTSSGSGDSASADASTAAAPVGDPEICDGKDNDLDGLIDEVGSDDVECGDCALMQGAGQAWWLCDAVILDWQASDEYCRQFGATSAEVRSEEAQAFLETEIEQGWYWMSAREDAESGQWTWRDGTPVDFTNWGGNQPDEFEPNQDCIRLTLGLIDPPDWFHGAWDDFECEQTLAVLCSASHEL